MHILRSSTRKRTESLAEALLRMLRVAMPVLLISACSAPPPPPPPEKTVFDPLTQQIDRAKAVQGTVDTHTDETRKRVEAAENGETSP